MSNPERIKLASFTAIITLCGLLIVIINTHTLFSEFFFYSIVVILIGVIVIVVAYAFLWERGVRFFGAWSRKRRRNALAREYFDDFSDFVERFISLGEFKSPTHGIMGVLAGLIQKDPPKELSALIEARRNDFISILYNPLHVFKQKVDELHWKTKEVNYEFLSSIVREFENYVSLHKRLYVDFAVRMSGRMKNLVSEEAKRSYSNYKDDYNQFIVAYVEFAKKCEKARLKVFNTNLEKAYES